MSSHKKETSIVKLEQLAWIADAPMFIDEFQIEQFFDAIVRPEFEHVGIDRLEATSDSEKIEAIISLDAEAKLPPWLTDLQFVPQLDLTASGGGGYEKVSGNSNETVSHLKPIWNAERQLEELTRQYLLNYPDRIYTLDGNYVDETFEEWTVTAVQSSRFPRPLAYLDIPAGTKLIPTAAESMDGGVSLLYEEFGKILTNENGGPQGSYPKDDGAMNFDNKKKEYWKSFMDYFSATKAMVVVEEAAKNNGRFEWIDFRLPIGENGDTIHLHLCPRGKYPAGSFGYNFIRRAYHFGVRLVATVKSGPDLNVMAIYEK